MRRRTQNINGGGLEDKMGEVEKGKGKGRRKWRGSGIITLRGNEKCEDKNSKYQWWGIGR